MSPNSQPETKVPLGGSNDLTKDDIIDLLSNDDENELKSELEPEKKIEKEEKEEELKKEEEPEKDEIEIKVDEEEEEPVELVTPFKRKEILKKYPEIFKDFPYLEKAYYSDQQYKEILPTLDDAKEAIEKAEILDRFENDLASGNIENILAATKEHGQKSFNKVVDNYMSALAKVDSQSYHHIVGNLIRHTIVEMVQEAKDSDSEALQQAAQILHQFIFGTSKFSNPKNLSNDSTDETNKERTEIQHERAQFIKETFETKRDDLNAKITGALKSTIDNHIDPKQSMTDYVKKNAVRDALDNLDVLIQRDTNFVKTLDKLWEKAFKDKFSETSIRNIRSAYLSKAKTLLAPVIQKARNDALKGLGKRKTEDNEEETDRRGPVSPSRASTTKTKKDEIPKDMSNKDFIMQD